MISKLNFFAAAKNLLSKIWVYIEEVQMSRAQDAIKNASWSRIE